MTFRLRLIGLFCLIPIWSFAQLYYSNHDASFQVSQQAGQYRVKCMLNQDVTGSRHLKRIQNRLRLRAVDLMGNYIVFNSLNCTIPDKDQLFQAFVDYNNLGFRAQVENLSTGQWDFCDGMRCITFACNTSHFIINDHHYPDEFDFSAIMMLDFRKNKSMRAACRILSAVPLTPYEYLGLEMLFLSGQAPLDSSTAKLQKLIPGGRLENSLFGADSLMHSIVVSGSESINGGCPFGEMVKAKIMFTGAGIYAKDSVYRVYLDNLAACDNLWNRVMFFAAMHRDLTDFFGLEEATVFDVIGAYPVALDVFGLRIGTGGNHYKQALEAFARGEMKISLDLLKDEVNFSGITPEALNLIGACYRILDRPEKALPYLLLAFYIDSETAYLTGNTCLCLDALGFNEIHELAAFFYNDNKTDNWSKEQISNLQNQ